jgi:hypothetical protein
MACKVAGYMKITIVVVLMTVGLSVFAPRAEAGDEAVIRVRLHDYVGLTSEAIADAQQAAARFYEPIGVTIDWAPTYRPHARKKHDGDLGPLQDFTINVLSASMVAKGHWAPDALGAAVVAREGGGSIAYVLYDRLKTAAAASRWPTSDLLALVIAHELGHLLLPPGSHSEGLMHANWDVSELRRMHLTDLAFTRNQMSLIRERLAEMVATH